MGRWACLPEVWGVRMRSGIITGLVWLWVALGLAGCDASPSPKFFGAAQAQTEVDGRSFTVFHDQTRAEIVRLGWADKSERAGMQDQMIRAAEQVTGCTVQPASIEGDSGEIRVRLRCPP